MYTCTVQYGMYKGHMEFPRAKIHADGRGQFLRLRMGREGKGREGLWLVIMVIAAVTYERE